MLSINTIFFSFLLMTIHEENIGSPLISSTDTEPHDPEIPIFPTKSDLTETSEFDKSFDEYKKPFRHFLLYAFFSFSGLTTLILSFIFKSYLNTTLLLILYEIGFFMSIPILLIFFEAYHYFLQPMYNHIDESQEKTERADTGAN